MNLKKILLATTAATLVSGAAMAADDGLVVLDWSGYEDEGFFQKYIAQHGDAPTYSFFGEEEEAFQNCVRVSERMSHTRAANLYQNG